MQLRYVTIAVVKLWAIFISKKYDNSSQDERSKSNITKSNHF